MLTRIRKAMETKDSGFTLIELLVVMIIIGILAAIAIPVFLNQRKGAVDASVKSDLRTISTEVESYYTDLQAYPDAPGAATVTDGTATAGPIINTVPPTAIKVSKGNDIDYTYTAATDSYCLIATNPKASTTWYYNSSKGGLLPKGTTAC